MSLMEPLLAVGESKSVVNARDDISEEGRLVYVHQPEKGVHFPKNIIVTSRYNVITFFPKCLLEQFRRLANVYFLVVGGIAAVGEYTKYFETAVQPEAILAPMMTVIFISMMKEAVEDIKRHQADGKVNSKGTRLISPNGDVVQAEWRQLEVGNLVLLLADDEIPADVICLSCGGVQGKIAYVETAAIDGETNLKVREPCLSQYADEAAGKHKRKESSEGTIPSSPLDLVGSNINVGLDRRHVFGVDLLRHALRAEVEHPNESIHQFSGSLEIVNHKDISGDNAVDTTQFALSSKNLLLRGSVLRATEWCVGLVVYTGSDTKLSRNSKRPPSKLSSVDRIVNRTLMIAISVMILVCIISMVFGILWIDNNNSATYLCLTQNDLPSTDGGGCMNSSTQSELTIFTFATLYNNFVCISMYVSLEMVYICQGYFISKDLKLYDDETDTPAECHSSGLCADLGQVQYVLSDKTGTLTKNVMKLRRCSVAGAAYGAPIELPLPPSMSDLRKIGNISRNVSQDTTHSPLVLQKSSKYSDSKTTDSKHQQGEQLSKIQHSHSGHSSHSNHSHNHMLNLDSPSVHDLASLKEPGPPEWLGLEHLTAQSPLLATEADKQAVTDFLRVLCACNTVMLMPDKRGEVHVHDFDSLKACLQAESADEVALVLAAAEHSGAVLSKRSNSEILITGLFGTVGAVATKKEGMHLLAVNEFESDRKRMSVLVHIDGQANPVLLCKGADSSMLSHCRHGNHTNTCLEHIEQFASSGLRTLVLSKREVTEEFAQAWMLRYKAASNNIHDRQRMLSECAKEIETDMELLGAVGIEDELQDEVSETIQMLQRAGLNVWMITGDKAETAIAISRMCGLVTNDHAIEKIINIQGDQLRQKIIDLHNIYKAREDAAPNIALIVDGIALESLFNAPDLKVKFTDIARKIPTIVACRVSPLQKAALVKMIKTSPEKPITLAIGDGANDVGMINEARVGVGISGKEGRHAANSADFAISQFKFLVPLLLEHGRFNYIRCSKLVLYSFFKNLLLVSTLFYYAIYSGFSGTVPLDTLVFSGFNFYLGLPIVALGALDFDVPRRSVYIDPFLAYSTGRLGELLNLTNMLRWCLFSFVQGMMLFAVAVRMVGGEIYDTKSNSSGSAGFLDIQGVGVNMSYDGIGGGLYVEGFLMYTAVVCAMQYKVVSMTHCRTWINWFMLGLSMAGYFLFTYVYGLFPTIDWYNIMPVACEMTEFWLAMLLLPIMLVLSDYVVDRLWTQCLPSSQDKLVALADREERMGRLRKLEATRAIPLPSTLLADNEYDSMSRGGNGSFALEGVAMNPSMSSSSSPSASTDQKSVA